MTGINLRRLALAAGLLLGALYALSPTATAAGTPNMGLSFSIPCGTEASLCVTGDEFFSAGSILNDDTEPHFATLRLEHSDLLDLTDAVVDDPLGLCQQSGNDYLCEGTLDPGEGFSVDLTLEVLDSDSAANCGEKHYVFQLGQTDAAPGPIRQHGIARNEYCGNVFTVTNTGDQSDVTLGGMNPPVGNTPTQGCTLRAAIQNANIYNNATPDTIIFNLPDPSTITPGTVLDGLIAPVDIIGPEEETVVLDGNAIANTMSGENGLVTFAANSSVEHLGIVRFPDAGVLALSAATRIQGNEIGTNESGTDLGNGGPGIFLQGVAFTVGGPGFDGDALEPKDDGNVIGWNGGPGIRMVANQSVVQRNYIGVTPGGFETPNSNAGVLIDAPSGTIGNDNQIGGADEYLGNVISFNAGDGVRIAGGATSGGGNSIWWNRIEANTNQGVEITGGAGNRVGDDGLGNVIRVNGGFAVIVTGATAANTIVQGNFIGTDDTNLRGGGSLIGIVVSTGARADISHNTIGLMDIGIFLGSNSNVVANNYIGTNELGEDIGNSSHGIEIEGNNNEIGLGPFNTGNTIAFNGGDGIAVSAGTGNRLRFNEIFDNDGLGIDLNDDGVTANDANDADTGPNNRQNFAILDYALGEDNTRLAYRFQGAPSAGFNLITFFSPTCDPSGHGEAAEVIGISGFTTDAGGKRESIVNLGVDVPLGMFVTAIVVDASGNTSEFSNCAQVIGALPTCDGLEATIVGTSLKDNIVASDDGDVIHGMDGADVIVGGAMADTICGGKGADDIEGRDEDDRIFGQNGNDSLDGGKGDDFISGANGGDEALGQEGEDEIVGGVGADQISGGDDDDALFGNDQADVLDGDEGDDDLNGGKGNDGLDGGEGGENAGGDDCNGQTGNADTAVNCEVISQVP
jgi:hypothetical protein